jgi:hypothetical protein
MQASGQPYFPASLFPRKQPSGPIVWDACWASSACLDVVDNGQMYWTMDKCIASVANGTPEPPVHSVVTI